MIYRDGLVSTSQVTVFHSDPCVHKPKAVCRQRTSFTCVFPPSLRCVAACHMPCCCFCTEWATSSWYSYYGANLDLRLVRLSQQPHCYCIGSQLKCLKAARAYWLTNTSHALDLLFRCNPITYCYPNSSGSM